MSQLANFSQLDAFLADPRPSLLAYIHDCFLANPTAIVPAFDSKYTLGDGCDGLDLSIWPSKDRAADITSITAEGVICLASGPHRFARFEDLRNNILFSICRRLRDEMFKPEPLGGPFDFMDKPKLLATPNRPQP